MISLVAKKCGIGVDAAAEVVDSNIAAGASAKVRATRTKVSAAKANKAATAEGFRRKLSSNAKYKSVVTRTGENVTAKTVESTAKRAGYKGQRSVVRGLLQRVYHKDGAERYVLSVHVPENTFQGAAAGVLTFIISEGVSVVGFAKGEMTEDAFMVETGKNAGAALVDGLAVYVVCSLGLGPAGVVSLVVGVGAYVIYDIAFNVLYDINKYKGVTLDDYLGVLPTEIQRRPSALDYEGACRVLNYEGRSPGLGYQGRGVGLDYTGKNPGLDFKGKNPGLVFPNKEKGGSDETN